MKRANAFIGAPVERVEDLRFLRGRGTYVGDIESAGALHAAILRSPRAHGRLRGIETATAGSLPGVAAVITSAEIPGAVPTIPLRQHPLPEGERYLQPVIAHEKVRFVGEPLAVVLATSRAIAEDALALIDVDIEPLPVVADAVSPAADKVALFEAAGTNRVAVIEARKGDADAAFAGADYRRRERFSVQRHTASPLEPRGLLAEWDETAGRLTVHGATKVAFFNRRTLAGMLGLPEAAVELIEVDVGGGFGARGEFYPEDFLIPFAARRLGRSVCWVEDRHEHLMAMNHARDMHAELEIACRRDGTVLGVRGRVHVDVGAYVRTNGFSPSLNVVQVFTGPYDIANVALDAAVSVTNKTPAGTYRGPGRFEANFFCERLMQMAADDLGIDPVAFRRHNLLREDQLPYRLPGIVNVGDAWDTECDSGCYEVVLDRCLEAFDWPQKQKLQGRRLEGRHHGVAVACFVEGGAGGVRENARMTLEADGSVTVAVGSSALGQGLETVLGQIAADALGLPMERIRVLHGSTSLVREGTGSFHSRSTVIGGSAILLAAEALLEALRAAAATECGCTTASVRTDEGAALCEGRRIGFGAFAGLSVERTFENKKHTYCYGAHAAHVAVDPGTGRVEVLDYVTVEDVGRIINPATLHGQVLGSVVQGLGSVFLEHLQYDEEGQLLTGSLADYLLPTATDFPRIRGISLALRPSPNNPLGAKGAGEGGLIAVGGAISNAVAAALRPFGVEPRDLPLSPPRLWALIQDGARGSPGRASPGTAS